MHPQPWASVYCKDVVQVFHPKSELSPAMMYRACRYIIRLTKYKYIDVPDTVQMHFLTSDIRHVRQYLKGECDFKMRPWLANLAKKQILFVPTLRNGRWNATVCWEATNNTAVNYMRVYNSNPKTRQCNDRYAKYVLNLLHTIEGKEAPKRSYVLHPTHDIFNEPSRNRNSGIVVLDRLW